MIFYSEIKDYLDKTDPWNGVILQPVWRPIGAIVKKDPSGPLTGI